MEYDNQRKEYVNKYLEILQSPSINLDGILLNLLSKHRVFGEYTELIKNMTLECKQCLILLEFTNTRHKCNELIKILRDSNQNKLAKVLLKYNSPETITYTNDVKIIVNAAINIKGPTKEFPNISDGYLMSRNPRGMAVIINNVSQRYDVVTQKYIPFVYNESQRFANVFKQLLFDVKPPVNDLTAQGIIDKMKEIREQIKTDFTNSRLIPQCLIVMIITHGFEERVEGIDSCNNTNPDDHVEVSEIVKIFNQDNFNFKTPFPKLFFFTCCRIFTTPTQLTGKCYVTMDRNNGNETYQFFSCAQGYETFVNDSGYTHFGKAFSESIAQYACKEDLVKIMGRSTTKLRAKWGQDGDFTPEIRCQGLTTSLYFNPHWSE